MRALSACTLLLSALAASGAWAATADRARPLIIDAGSGSVEVNKKPGRTEVNGPVLVTKGTMLLRASRLVAIEQTRGYRVEAFAESNGAVQFSMDLDSPGGRVEARADSLEYEEDSGLMRLVGNARLRKLVGGQLERELAGNLIVFDTVKEAVVADGKPLSQKSGEGGVRVILMPPPGAASEPSPAPLPLQSVPALAPKPPSK
jgi:lipopolysaccharide export system protein LptA